MAAKQIGGNPEVLIKRSARRKAPGTHVFIVGVSHYAHTSGRTATPFGRQSGITDLTTAARSASEVAAWLIDSYCNPDAPLATVRVLLSPGRREQIAPRVAALMGGVTAPATRNAVEDEYFDFERDCRSNSKNVAVVYIAGHGVQLNNRGALVLLEDFAVANRRELHGAIDVVGCHQAMQSGDGAPVRQLWLSDACRQRPAVARNFEMLTGAFDPSTRLADGGARSCPLFLSASPSENAYAVPNQSTVFSQALLGALQGAAASKPDEFCDQWHISATGLARHLAPKVNDLLKTDDAQQNVDVAALGRDMVVHHMAGPPDIDIVITLDPTDAQPVPRPRLRALPDGSELTAGSAWPMTYRGKAGIYELDVDVQPPLTRCVATSPFMAEPPRSVQRAKVN